VTTQIFQQNPRICPNCVMDSTVPDIIFNEQADCSYCSDFSAYLSKKLLRENEGLMDNEQRLVEQIKREGRGKRYDCVIGISGGIDSSWALVKAVGLGLRPLAVHMDNGWNSELAQSNIANLVQNLNIDLHTHVIDWEEYRGLMQAFFDAGVIDIELLYDNAMLAVNYKAASKVGTRFILSGSNSATEGMVMPPGWNWYKFDARNIRSISKAHGGPKAKSFPSIGTVAWAWQSLARRVRWVPFLDYANYSKEVATKELVEKLSFKPYPYKHYESIFTRFYQGFLLPEKFGVDKRKLHLSTLVVSGQMSRNEAMQKLSESPYPSPQDCVDDRAYFLKKLRWSESDLFGYLGAEQRSHSEFNSEYALYRFLMKVRKILATSR